MSTQTDFLGLTLVDINDPASLQDFNANMELIDDKIHELDARTAEVEDGSIDELKLADDSVTAEKIVDGSITETKLAIDSVTNEKIVNKTIDILAKLDCELVTYTSDLIANTEDGVPHSLGRIPLGYIVVGLNKPAIVFKGASAWSTTHIFLQCNQPSVAVSVIVF